MRGVKLSEFSQKHWKSDVLSGLLVSLVALPLSLGIAGASGFPPIMGVLTSIVGGLLVSFFSGSEITIKGPAAGLITIIAQAVEEFGRGNAQLGWQLTATTIACAGLVQIILGRAGIAKLTGFFPISAVHGMLAAIGIIIISKQILLAEGINPKLLKGKEPLELIQMIPQMLNRIEWHIALIGLTSIVIMFLWPYLKNKMLQKIPAAIPVIIISIILGKVFHLENSKFKELSPLIDPGNLNFNLNANFNLFTLDVFLLFIKFLIMLSVIGALESLLTGRAMDLLDPYHRNSDLNQDLQAIGGGNVLCGLLGGLPMISEVARSSANIANGGKTRWANFFHGAFLLLFVLALTPLIRLIPVAGLSGILIYVGYRLAHPSEFKHMKEIGLEQLSIYLTTIVVTLSTDLLLGVGSGIMLKIIVNIASGVRTSQLLNIRLKKEIAENKIIIKILSPALFTNWHSFIKQVGNFPKQNYIEIDFSQTPIIDHTFIKSLSEMAQEYNQQFGTFKLIGLNKHMALSKHPYSRRILILNND